VYCSKRRDQALGTRPTDPTKFPIPHRPLDTPPILDYGDRFSYPFSDSVLTKYWKIFPGSNNFYAFLITNSIVPVGEIPPVTNILLRALGITFSVSGAAAAILTVALVLQNSGPFGFAGVIELFVVMLWVCGLLNIIFLIGLAVLWPVLKMLASDRLSENWYRYLVSGLLAANLIWILWHHLSMAHQWISARPFITWTGVIENISFIVIGTAIIVAGVQWRKRGYLAGAATAVTLTVVMLALNNYEVQQVRTYALEDIQNAAGEPGEESASNSNANLDSPIVILGIDGLSWNVMVPLLEAGKLPTFSRLIGNGAVGYLDNGDESLSPSIWNTIFTGRPVSAHGVQGFLYYRLPWSNRFIENPLMTKPSTDSFYGLKYLLELFPNPGLWEVKTSKSDTQGRATPFLWEILSFHSKTVAVANPMVLDEDKKVNGAQISFREKIEEGNLNYAYPEELAEKWGSSFRSIEIQEADDFLKRKRRILAEQIKFTIEMMKEYQADLRIYYSHYIDTAAHKTWDFYAQDKFFLTELPSSLTREEWGQLVIDNIDDPGFNAYLIMDSMVETFSDANPDATFIIVSDHGMTYSGYEHFNSTDGVIIMSGPRIKKGITIQDAHILDITPTTLAALDTPISEKLEGKIIESPFIRTPIPLYISDYPESLTNASESGDLSLSDEEMERLRSLGYIH
jgi:hypothetical protein